MHLGRQWDERLKIWDEAFAPNLYRKTDQVELEGFTTMEHLSLEEAKRQSYRPFPEGTRWGEKWEYGWFRCRITLPTETEGKRVLLHIGTASEMLVYVNGEEAGSIDKQHEFVQLTSAAISGYVCEIYVEAYAGHGPRLEHGGIYPMEVIPVPEPPEFQCLVQESSYGVWNEEMFQAYADYHTLYELWKALPDSSLRGMQIADALKEFTCKADFELSEPFRTESVCTARQVLLPLLKPENSSSAPVFTVFGQSHLDLAWLWTWEETRRKSARTYANQTALMDRYPEYRFLLCEPPILENLKTYYPKLYERVKEKVRGGQFIPEGAVWVEGDTNMAGGESLIRQFVWGKRWFQKEFGVDAQVAWLPDTFGFTGALPQIMKGCRVPYFATQKLVRSDPESERFPYNLFWWEGIDGSRVLSHLYKENNAVLSPLTLIQRWEKDRRQQDGLSGMMFPFGYGDGGGGSTEIMVEVLRRCRNLDGVPVCRVESPAEYFRRALEAPVNNVYYGELYLAWHRGTYTAQARIKRGVRKAEVSLRQAEFLAGILRLRCRLKEEWLTQLNGMWEKLLFCEFHDVLPGTSIRRVNEEAEAALEQIKQESDALAETFLCELAGKRAVFNALSWERKEQGLSIPACGYVRLVETEEAEGSGSKIKESICQDENQLPADQNIQLYLIFGNTDGIEIGSGKTVAGMQSGTVSTVDTNAAAAVIVENTYYRVQVDRLGRITSLRSRDTGYEYVSGALNELHLYHDVNIYYDAWEIGRMYESSPVELGQDSTLDIRWEKNEVHLEICRKEANFTWEQEIIFLYDSPRIEFCTKVDWRERHKLLKVAFPTSVYTKEAIEEIQFGYLKRPTHKSRQYERDLYETCHHRYAALSDGKNGLAVLNDCKYGISAQDSTLALTLLRAPVMPDMEADMGEHTFTYALCLFDGPFTESGIVREAYELNTPVIVSDRNAGKVIGSRKDTGSIAEMVSYFSVDQKNIILETCKPAMDEEAGVVLRLYESMGSAVKCRLSIPNRIKRVWICNMLEEKQKEVVFESCEVELWFHAFEIVTLLLEV